MFDLFNLLISMTALILAIASAIIAARQYRKSEALRAREEMCETLGAMIRFEVMFNAVRRERAKTGAALTEFEENLFNDFDKVRDGHKIVRPILELALKQRSVIPTFEELGNFRVYRETANANTEWLKLLHEQFIRFNDRHLGELRTRLNLIRARLVAAGFTDLPELP